jgi:membrane protein DedA with SNARE-associated domain
MNMPKFIVYTFVGSFPWCWGLAWVGMKLGEKWNSDPTLKAAFHRFDLAIGIVIVLSVVAFVWHKLRSARRPGAGAAS